MYDSFSKEVDWTASNLSMSLLVAVLVGSLFLIGGLGDQVIAGEAVNTGLGCVDETDSGFDTETYGSIFLLGLNITVEDTCISENRLNELTCVGERPIGTLIKQGHNCN